MCGTSRPHSRLLPSSIGVSEYSGALYAKLQQI